eukprot:356176_1
MAQTFFHKLNNVNDKSKLIVYGYLREFQNDTFHEICKVNPYYNIPEIIQNICVIYYHLYDEWDSQYIANVHTLNEENQCIEHTGRLKYESSFCSTIAHSDYGEYHWKFKIKHDIKQVYWIVIGIWKTMSKPKPPTHTHFTEGSSYKSGYGYVVTEAQTTGPTGGVSGGSYGVKCKSGDIVDMFLNFDDLTLKYSVNDKDMGVAYQITNTPYRAAIFTHDKGAAVQLLYD